MSEESRKNPSLKGNPNADFTDITIFGTPVPKATSTVRRKTTLPPRFEFNPDNQKTFMNETSNTLDSSLGILHNISTLLDENSTNVKRQSTYKKGIDTERELARKLLQKCSEPLIKSDEKTNKENDVNVQNVSRASRSSSLNLDQFAHSSQMDKEKDSLFVETNPKTSLSGVSVVFEPREITARSSEMSKTPENFLPDTSQPSFGGFSFNSNAAEMMERFADEEFQSDSRAANQLLADELSWRENYSYAMPLGANNEEKEHLEFSCFSGIIGDFDLSLESHAGRKISIGEYFKRRCGNIGELSESRTAERPSLGFSIRSPTKREKLEPLVNITGMTNASESCIQKEKENPNSSATIDMTKENSVMSLSCIAQVLENINDGTPRKLVDQLIMAKKKRKQPQTAISDTYTLLPARSSLPTSISNTLEAERLQNESSLNDHTLKNQQSKLSLDSRINPSNSIKASPYAMIPSKIERNTTPKTQASTSTTLDRAKIKENQSDLSLPGTSNLSLFHTPKEGLKAPLSKHEKFKEIYIKKGSPTSLNYDDEQISPKGKVSPQRIQSEKVKNEKLVNKDSSNSFNLHSSLEESVTVGKKTQELCMCVVGIKKEIDLDVRNKGDRWILCSASLSQIQGDSEAIELLLPIDVLVEPNSSNVLRIEVNILKMTAPILAVLNITTVDFVTQSRWDSKYLICFVPEEMQVDVLTPSGGKELQFETIAENESQILPITFENKNCLDLPLFIFIAQNEPNTFNIQKTEDDSSDDENSNSKFVKFLLKSRESRTINVEFKGVPLNSFAGPEPSNNLQKVKGKLILQTQPNSKEDSGTVINEIPLFGSIGICKLSIVNTKLPILIPKLQNKSLTFYNLGSIGIPLSAMVVENEGQKNEKICNDFVVKPETLFLQSDETGSFSICYMPRNSDDSTRHVMVKITAGRDKYLYPAVGKNEPPVEETYDSFQSDSLQHLRAVSSPHSPFNGSPNSGRDSPGSSVSSLTVAGDVIPIRATHSSLSWTSIKVGKSDTKEITIRNMSNNKIKLHIYILPQDQNFKFVRERHTTCSTSFSLQSAESKTLKVLFNPRAPGASTAKLLFQHYSHAKDNSESRPSKQIPLFGYGGSAKLDISKAYKDTGGQMWLSLGKMTGGSLEAKIKLENQGDLTCYVKLKLEPKAIYPSMAFSWCVEPSELLLNPKEAQWVSLDFRPRKEDLQLLGKNTVSHVGTLKLTYGDEPTRLRIRRLFNKMKESASQNLKDNEFWNVMYPICKSFPGEISIRDITMIRDSNSNLGDLCRGVNYQELKLTVESSSDETLSMLHDDMDETQTFYSLCSDSLNDITVNGDSYLPAESVLEPSHQNYRHEVEKALIVKPSVIKLVPFLKSDATIVISTSCQVAQPFETELSDGHNFLSIIPNSGMIPTGRSLPLKIECRKQIMKDFEAVLRIYTENDRRDVLIKVSNRKD